MRRSAQIFWFSVIMVTLYAGVQPVRGAYCALRDPVHEIYDFYPEADAYRSIIRTVDVNAREEVAEQLPFTLHFNELAKHTLYVAVAKDRPIGLVHVRSEKGRWGLIEIAWSFDLDLNVRGFRFQRCRDLHKTTLQEEAFQSQIIGKSLAELRPMLSKDGLSINTDKINVPEGSEALVLTVLRSGMKTITVTEIVWSQDLQFFRTLAEAKSMFPDTSKLIRVREIYTPNVYQSLQAIEQAGDSIVQRDTVELYLALDKQERLQGILIKTECVLAKQPLMLWWAVTPDHRIYRVKPARAWPSDEYEKVFVELEGMTEQDIHQCSTAAQVVGAEVLVVSRSHVTG